MNALLYTFPSCYNNTYIPELIEENEYDNDNELKLHMSFTIYTIRYDMYIHYLNTAANTDCFDQPTYTRTQLLWELKTLLLILLLKQTIFLSCFPPYHIALTTQATRQTQSIRIQTNILLVLLLVLLLEVDIDN